MPRKASTRWAGLRSMTVRYFFRRTGRSQKGPGGLESAPGPPWPPPAWPGRRLAALRRAARQTGRRRARCRSRRRAAARATAAAPQRGGSVPGRPPGRAAGLLRDGLPQKPEPPPWLLLARRRCSPGSPPRGAALRVGPLPRVGAPLRAGAPLRDGADPNVGGAAPGPGPALPPDGGGAAAGGRGATPGQRCRAAPGRAGADAAAARAPAGAPEAPGQPGHRRPGHRLPGHRRGAGPGGRTGAPARASGGPGPRRRRPLPTWPSPMVSAGWPAASRSGRSSGGARAGPVAAAAAAARPRPRAASPLAARPALGLVGGDVARRAGLFRPRSGRPPWPRRPPRPPPPRHRPHRPRDRSRHAGRLRRVAPGPPGGPVGGEAGDTHGGGVHRVPPGEAACLGQPRLGPVAGADHAVADRREQVHERFPVDEYRHGDQGDHQDLQRPGQHRVTGAHDQGVGVQQDAEHQGHGRLL